MTQNSSLSFLSKFDPNEFFDFTKDLPESLEVAQDAFNNDANNIQIIGTHLLVPENSISQIIENFNSNNNIEENTIIDFDALTNLVSSNDDSPPTSNLPSIDTFPGIHGFKLNITSTEGAVKKSASWTYSKKLNKLYCNPNIPCPVDISVTTFPPLGTVIRATPVYSKYEHIEQIIKRCENHKKSKEFDSDVILPDYVISHFIRCRHNQASYFNDLETGRESVVVPFEKPQNGSYYTTVLYQFMCYSSCIGGSQKPVKIVLTLENNGEIIGRDSFEIKICACPGRDRSTDENKFEKKTKSILKRNQKKLTKKETDLIQTQNKKSEIIKIKSIGVENKEQDAQDEFYTLKIKGKKNYEILKNLNEALEIQDMYTKIKNKPIQQQQQQQHQQQIMMRNNSSFMFKTNSILGYNTKRKQESIINLEQFLESLNMSAYYNTIISKGINNLPELLNSNKRKINSLKISQSDTHKLWNAIQKLNDDKEDDRNKKQKLSDDPNYIKLSKYQIRYSFDLKN